MSAPLLKTKLHIPAITGNIVDRKALYERLGDGLSRRVTLVASPAGFGKTTFISSWVHNTRCRAAWVSLDETDNDPTLFWAYVISSFQNAIPGGERKFLDQFDLYQLPPSKTLLIHLINGLDELQEQVILVLDDYHVISNPQIHQELTYLIDNQPRALHIIVVTRADPPLPISRLRGHSLLVEFRSADLRLTPAETAAFLNEVMGLDLVEKDIAALEKRTEGWIIGLQLAALSMQNRSDKSEFIAAFSGSFHYILEYLTEEVIDHLSDDLRSFLLQTSVLEQFNAPLCNQVTRCRDSTTLLANLQHQNLFIIPLDDEHFWFRYHHLFRDLLKNRLQKEYSTEQIGTLYHRASLWYQEENALDEAIKYALLAHDFDRAADMIEQTIDQVIARGQIKTLMQWIGSLPEEVIQARPCLLMQQGWVIFLSGQVILASQILQQAKRALATLPEKRERDFLHGRLSAMLSTITALTRDLPGAIAEADEALVILPTDEFVFRARALRAKGVSLTFLGEMAPALASLETAKTLALRGKNKFLAAEITSQIGTLRKHQGKLTLAQEAYQSILDLYEHPEQAPPACLGYIGLAEMALERNQLKEVETYLNFGIDLCQKGNIGYALQPAYLINGLLQLILGDEQTALDAIQQGENLSRQGGGSLESILALAYFQTRLCLQLGNLEKARQWVNGALLPHGRTFDKLPITLDEMHQGLLARVFFAEGEFDKILEISDRIIPQAERGGRLGRVIELSLIRALALYQLGIRSDALASLEACLVLAEPEGYIRLFLEAGNPVRSLLQTAIEQGIHRDYATRLLAALDSPTQEADSDLIEAAFVESLTTRETDVLRLMCAGYSNQQIADDLIVSVNTVKKHTSNIYGKLGVRNRAQAVLRARENGLI